MRLTCGTCVVRSWEADDLASLVAHANNRRIWEHLRDQFPHPYTRRDGKAFLEHVMRARPETTFAIDVAGQAVGAVGYVLRTDVERVSAEIGYWLGEAYWGRGLCAAAVAAVTHHAVAQHGLTRVYALPFAHNVASCRVLEKAGFTVEGRLRRSAIKDGRIIDQLLYGFIVPEATGSE